MLSRQVPEGEPHSTLVRMCRVRTAAGDPVTFLVLRRNADNSVSGTVSFAAHFAAKYTRCCCISQPNAV